MQRADLHIVSPFMSQWNALSADSDDSGYGAGPPPHRSARPMLIMPTAFASSRRDRLRGLQAAADRKCTPEQGHRGAGVACRWRLAPSAGGSANACSSDAWLRCAEPEQRPAGGPANAGKALPPRNGVSCGDHGLRGPRAARATRRERLPVASGAFV